MSDKNNNSQASLKTGEVFADRYEIVKMLGQGGMGEVYLAKDTLVDNTLVALKFLNAALLEDEKQKQRFLREVLLTRKVVSKKVVKVFDANIHDNRLYFAMEYVEGISLKEKIDDKPVATDEVALIIKDLAEGLQAIHEVEIIHRDMKPANVLITTQGEVKITDFGVARPDRSDLTGHDEVIGSSMYMSPEAWTGKEGTQKLDIYSLGIVTYQMLTGVLPYDGDTAAQIMFKHLEGKPLPPSNIVGEIPAWLDNLTLEMMQTEPESRPTTAKIIETVECNLLNVDSESYEEAEEEVENFTNEIFSPMMDPTTKIQSQSVFYGAEKKTLNPQFGQGNLLQKRTTENPLLPVFYYFEDNYKKYLKLFFTFFCLAGIAYLLNHQTVRFLADSLPEKEASVTSAAIFFLPQLIFYSLIFALPFYFLTSFYNSFKKSLLKYLSFTSILSFLLAVYTVIQTALLLKKTTGIDFIKLQGILFAANNVLEKIVKNFFEIILLIPTGTIFQPVLRRGVPNLFAGQAGVNLNTLLYYMFLAGYILTLYLFFRKTIWESKLNKKQKLILPLSILGLWLLEILFHLLKIIPVKAIKFQIGNSVINTDLFTLLAGATNLLVLSIILFILFPYLSYKKSAQNQ